MSVLLTVTQEEGGASLALSGEWTLARIREVDAALGAARLPRAPVTLDGERLQTLDTSGALALLLRLGAAGASVGRTVNLKPGHSKIIETVRAQATPPAPVPRPWGVVANIGYAAVAFGRLVYAHLGFVGSTAASLAELAVRPRRMRWKEFLAQLQHVCIDAIPVVALVTALIGMVLAYLFGLQAEKYGASIFVVDAVAIGSAREIAPLLVAVIVAGRSGAAFTAQLGSMRLTEEIDALQTLGLSPMQVLVVPRVLALAASLPLLVFVGDIAAMVGAMAASGPLLGIVPAVFIERVHSTLALRHVVIGLAKGAVFGAAIAVIGCRAGMTVARDARSIGIATTSTVVRCIVAVIVLDACFAVWLQLIGR
ncbi:MAG TPA: ABC transporter permease [Burkholderiales bacterium]|nr:ABC transporter permease [Burkholderiales bacterium]